MANLTPKQERFAQLYVELGNASEAYRQAYESKAKPESVHVRASEMLSDSKIRVRVQELAQAAAERAEIDASYVLRRLVEIDQMDAADILDDEGGLKPVSEWPKVWRTTISGMDINRLSSIGGGENALESVIQKIKWPDKLRNLELLGKHLTVGAFVERRDHTSSDGSMTPTFGMMYGKPQPESG